MTMRQIWGAGAALLLAAVPATAQYADGGYQGAQGGYVQGRYDTDGLSVNSVDEFYAPLSRYGRWLDSRYGRVWSPNVPRDWRPYTLGHWEDGRYGPTWRSDEPFGWAVYHFGRWAFDPRLGWVWAPDTVWGPGWVAWRDSDDVAGWAPLPPQASFAFSFGTGFGNDWSYDQWYQPAWTYVPRGYLYSRSLRGIYLPQVRNRDFWDRTRGVTRYDRVDGQVVNRSFGRRDGRRDDNAGRRIVPDGRDQRRDAGQVFRRDDTRRDGGFDQRRDGSSDPRRDGGFDQRRYNGGDQRGDLRGRRDGRDGAGVPLSGTGRAVVPPMTSGTVDRPRGFGGRAFDRRDVPAGSPPAQFERRAPSVMPMPGVAPRMSPPAAMPPAMARPAMPAAAPPAAPERPAAPRAQPRERNADERPQ